MKRRREGTLSERDWRSLDGDEFFSPELADLADFLDKADALATAMLGQGDLAHRRALRLRMGVRKLRSAAKREALEMLLYDAIETALAYATLRGEQRDDTRPDPRRRITRARYFETKPKARTRKEHASVLGVSLQKLREWEARNIEWGT